MAKDGVVTKTYGLRLKFSVDEIICAISFLSWCCTCSLILALLQLCLAKLSLMLVAVNLLPLSPKQGGGLGNRLQLFDCIHENWPYLSWKFLLSFTDFLSATGKCQAVTSLENEILASSFFLYLFLLLEQKIYIITLLELSMSMKPFPIGMRMKDFHSCFLVVTSVVSSIFCLNAIGSISNHDFIV